MSNDISMLVLCVEKIEDRNSFCAAANRVPLSRFRLMLVLVM